jgi:hypothetical protein
VHHVDFERKLKQAIIDRIEDKDKFISSGDPSGIFRHIKETKMNLESQLEEVKRLSDEMNLDNNYSRKVGIKTDDKLANISKKLYKLKEINM